MAVPAAQQPNEAEVRLLNSALTLFSEKGYEATKIREIIEGAGVTRPVLYYYFENKEDLFRRVFETMFSQLISRIEEASQRQGTCVERLKAIISAAFALAEENTQLVRLILQALFAPPHQGPPLDRNKLIRQRFKAVEHVIKDGLANQELSGGDSQSLTLVFLGLMDMHMMAKFHRTETRLSPELASALVDLFLAGARYREAPETNLASPFIF